MRRLQAATRNIIIAGMAAKRGRHSIKPPPPAARHRFPILFAAALCVSAAYGVTLPVLPFLVERIMGADAAAVARHTGSLTGSYTFALFILSPFWGVLSDRFDRRSIIAFGLTGSALSLLLLDSATTMTTLYLARIASGILSAAVLPAVLAYVAVAFHESERPQKFAAIASASTLGFLLGPAIGSWLSPMVLAPLSGMRIASFLMFDSPFFAVALMNLFPALTIALLPGLRNASQKDPTAKSETMKMQTADQTVIYCGLLLTCISTFTITVAEVGITLLGKQVLSLDPNGISRFFLICSIAMIVVQIGVFPACVRRIGAPRLVAAGMLLGVAGLALIPYAKTAAGTMMAFASVSIGTAILIPVLATLISKAAGTLQGKAMGQQASAANLGQALAASLTGFLFLMAPTAPFAVGAIAAMLGFLIAGKAKDKR